MTEILFFANSCCLACVHFLVVVSFYGPYYGFYRHLQVHQLVLSIFHRYMETLCRNIVVVVERVSYSLDFVFFHFILNSIMVIQPL